MFSVVNVSWSLEEAENWLCVKYVSYAVLDFIIEILSSQERVLHWRVRGFDIYFRNIILVAVDCFDGGRN